MDQNVAEHYRKKVSEFEDCEHRIERLKDSIEHLEKHLFITIGNRHYKLGVEVDSVILSALQQKLADEEKLLEAM